MKALRERPYRTLLTALMPLLVVYPLAHDRLVGRVCLDVMFTFLFTTTFLCVFQERHHRIIAFVLGVPTLVGAWMDYVFPDLPREPVAAGFHLFAAAFLALTVTAILNGIYSKKTLTADSIYGAFGGYFLLGLIFGHLYCVVETLQPGSFQGPGDHFAAQMRDESSQRFQLTYYSMVTLTTVGYGDIVPLSGPARGLAMMEAVVGQFYLVVLMAQLIGTRLAQNTTPADKDASG